MARLSVHIRLATEDPVTGLLNPRGFRRRLDEELAQAARAGESLSLMLIDLDGLKAINDMRGHEAGDRALRCLGDSLRRTIRLMDVSARTGGDEFAVILPSAGLERHWYWPSAFVVVSQTVCRIWLPPIQAERSRSVSPAACASPAVSIVRAADEALYEAKRTGRNRVVVRRLSDSIDSLPHRTASRT